MVVVDCVDDPAPCPKCEKKAIKQTYPVRPRPTAPENLKNRLPERLNPPIEPRDPLLELLNMAVPLLDHCRVVLLHPLGLLMNKRFRLPRQLSECLRPKMNIGLTAQLGR